jgi:two-component system sporulation sensor kinase B
MQLLGESKELPEKQKEYVKYAIQEMDRAESIIRDYLTYAKPSPENVEILDTKKVIEEVVHMMEPFANMNGVNMITDVKETILFGNKGLFQQALVNIIKNGIEAMPKGGKLEIEDISDISSSKIVIKDEGVGMTEVQKVRLGEPYFTTKEIKGTGLGMMVVYRIIETMGGKIKIDSELGKGTSVTLVFPKFQIEQKQQKANQISVSENPEEVMPYKTS